MSIDELADKLSDEFWIKFWDNKSTNPAADMQRHFRQTTKAGYLAGLEAAKGEVDKKTTEAIANYRQTKAMYDDGLSDGFDQAGQAIETLIKEAKQ